MYSFFNRKILYTYVPCDKSFANNVDNFFFFAKTSKNSLKEKMFIS